MSNFAWRLTSAARRLARGRVVAALIVGPMLVGPIVAAGGDDSVSTRVLGNTSEHVIIEFALNRISSHPVDINGRAYAQIRLGNEGAFDVASAPSLPRVCRAVIIPDDARMAVRVLAGEFYELTGVDVAPARGPIPRSRNPAEVPYTFGPAYGIDADYPGSLVRLRAPHILRDYRGVVVELYPCQYNPIARTLRVYSSVTVELFNVGPDAVNVLQHRPGRTSLAFDALYRRHFANYRPLGRYPPLDESGDMLIICHDDFVDNIQPLADHKNRIGISTTVGPVTSIGNTATAIKNYIRDVYETSDLAFVLLVGDAAQVATPYDSGGPSDPCYALLAGADSYPDILVGRFSAATRAEVDTQVQRTIEYERLPATQQEWFWRGAGIGSDTALLDGIRDTLLAHGYTSVDQLYDPGTTPAMIAAALNDGRGIVNYAGHGSATGWYPSGFGVPDVNALTNDNRLPFIFSVASLCGDFAIQTCFAEAWLRSQHGSEPTGAIGAYMSSILQYWQEPQIAQREFVDLYVNGTYVCFGTLCFAASCRMMDEYGSTGAQLFKGWVVFGDPSLRVVGSWVVPGDCDHDWDVDSDDFQVLAGCWTAPLEPAEPECAPADLDSDGDVELHDFALFQQGFTGPQP